MPGQAGGAGPGAFSSKYVFAYDPLRPARLPMAIDAWGPLGGVALESNEPWANALFGATTEPGSAELGTPRKVAEPAEAPINETTFFTPSSLPISHVREADSRAGIESPPSSEATPPEYEKPLALPSRFEGSSRP